MAKTIKADAMATMVNQIQNSLKASKAKQAKPSKPVITLSIDEQVKLAHEAGAAKGIELNARDTFNKAAQALREAKAVIGDARKCALAKAFLAARFPDSVAASTKANALAAFRAAVHEGKTYDENAKRKEKKQAAKTGPKTADTKKATKETDSDDTETESESEETAKSFSVSIARKGSAKKAAQLLRDLMNKMRDSEEYAPLAALIIDSLDEFEGNE